ncbi:MAG TPA: type II toxin-antitoxin system RelE/ParE family toxin [Anaeromyxobacteraceae bacterium]|nr:type II toxin-antitoxin system RelE/ParE family toxin [Anaeromyxobacteraceae bacterium]
MKVVLTPRAHARLEAIHDFVAAQDPASADRLVAKLHARMAALGSLPRRGRLVPELPGSGLREVVEGHFRIVYRLSGDEVQILTVFDGRLPLEREPLP